MIPYIHQSSLSCILGDVEGVLFDAYGVFWGGNEIGPYPHTRATMEKLVHSGIIVGILSNSTQSSEKEMEKLSKYGFKVGREYHFLVTSGDVARQIFQNQLLPFPTPNKKYWLLGEDNPKYSSPHSMFEQSPYKPTESLSDADFAFLAVPHIKGVDQTDPQLFRKATSELYKIGLPLVCPNPDHFAHEGKPSRLVVRQGSLAALYEQIGGKVFYIGKPQTNAFDAAMRGFHKHGVSKTHRIMMVGDTPETDIRGARSYGLRTALVMQTGIMAERIASLGLERAVGTLPENDMPDHFIAGISGSESLFELHPNLINKCRIIDLPLCSVLLEDNQHYPWVFLVPRVPNVSKIMDLSTQDQIQLTHELNLSQEIMWDLFKPTQLNVAAIGNKTSQLHIHLIARFDTDSSWPGTVWDSPEQGEYTQERRAEMIRRLSAEFHERML